MVEFWESGMDEAWAGIVKRGGKGSCETGLGKPVQAAELRAGTEADTDSACSGLCLPHHGLPGAFLPAGQPQPFPHVKGQVPLLPTPALGSSLGC